jgi:hypothetical protein
MYNVMLEWLAKIELKGMWKEWYLSLYEALYRHTIGGTEENHEILQSIQAVPDQIRDTELSDTSGSLCLLHRNVRRGTDSKMEPCDVTHRIFTRSQLIAICFTVTYFKSAYMVSNLSLFHIWTNVGCTGPAQPTDRKQLLPATQCYFVRRNIWIDKAPFTPFVGKAWIDHRRTFENSWAVRLYITLLINFVKMS